MNNKGARFAGKIRLNSLSIGATIIIVAMGTILFFQTLALSKLETELNGQQILINQTKNLASSLNSNAKDRTAQINELNRHLDCIVVFFSQPDRTQKAITDIDTCTLQNINTGTTTQHPTSILAPIPVTSPTKSVATTTPPKSSTPSASGSTSSGSSTTSSSPPSTTGSQGSTTPLGGSSNPSFLQKTVVTPLNNNIVQPIKNLLNDIL